MGYSSKKDLIAKQTNSYNIYSREQIPSAASMPVEEISGQSSRLGGVYVIKKGLTATAVPTGGAFQHTCSQLVLLDAEKEGSTIVLTAPLGYVACL